LVDQFPDFTQLADAKYGIAYALQQQKQLAAAEQMYEQVAKTTETETAAKARFMIGELKFGNNEYEAAIEQFLTVTVGYPYETWQALARFETARCFRELGDVERAATTLREMIEKHPQHPRVADAEKMLLELKP
jgi:TolA-binding protein